MIEKSCAFLLERVSHVHVGSASPEQLAPMSWSMVADGDAHCEIRWEIAHCLFASADNISELRISDIHSWRDTVFEVVAYVIDPFYYTGRKVLHRYVAIGKIESVTALDVIRQASLIIGQSTELAEAIVDAIWLHDVPNWFHLGLRFFPPFRYKSAQLNSGQHTVILWHWWRLCKQLVLYRVLQRREIELVPMRQAQA